MSLLAELAEFSRRYAAADEAPPPAPAPAPATPHPLAGRAGIRRSPWGASRLRGVYPLANGRYAAKLRTGGVLRHLGTFDTPDEAAAAVAREMGGGS